MSRFVVLLYTSQWNLGATAAISVSAAPIASGRGRKHLINNCKNSIVHCPAPTVGNEAVRSILHELSYTSAGGLLEAIKSLFLEACFSNTDSKALKQNQELSTETFVTKRTNYNASSTLNLVNVNKKGQLTCPVRYLKTLTPPGELHRRLVRLQWIGFLQQQVYRTGPTGRYLVSQLKQLMPPWNSDALSSYEDNHALNMDKYSFNEIVCKAVGLASSVNYGPDWADDKLLLVRSLYPVQIYRLIDSHVEHITTEQLFAITNLEASEYPPLAAEFFRLLGQRNRDKPPAARFMQNPLEPYKSIFSLLVDMSEQFFNEYVIHKKREEGTDGLHNMRKAIEQRAIERKLGWVREYIDSPGRPINFRKAHNRLTTNVPPLSSVFSPMSDKLRNSLSNDCDSFLEVIGQKLLNLAVHHYLPELRKRQKQNDSEGDHELQTSLLKSSHFPPSGGQISRAFNLDIRKRRHLAQNSSVKISSMSPDMRWRLKWLSPHVAENRLFDRRVLPKLEDFGTMFEELPLPSRTLLNYLSFCDSAESHIIDYWWNGQTVQDDVDVKWRLDGYMSPQEFFDYQYGGAARQPHSCIITRESIETLFNYLRNQYKQDVNDRSCSNVLASNGCYDRPEPVLLVGSSASRWGWFLQCLQEQISRQQISSCPPLKFVPVAIMPDSYSVRTVSSGNIIPSRPGSVGFSYHDAGRLSEVIRRHEPSIIICFCMPPGIDWSKEFRKCASVKEYVLIGPCDSDASGHLFDTWGFSTFFDKPRLIQSAKLIKNYHPLPPYIQDGFKRASVPSISAELLGSLDSPAIAFRRNHNVSKKLIFG